MFRIRFHGRGGQGMKTASRILGNAFFKSGFEVQDAPRYGAERRGAPIFAYVRADRSTINERGIINCPDLVVVADDSLIGMPAAGVTRGIDTHSLLLINSRESADTWQQRLKTGARIRVLATEENLADPARQPFIGSRCAAAAAALTGAIEREVLLQALAEELARMDSRVITENSQAAATVYDLMKPDAGIVVQGSLPAANDYIKPAWIDVPFENASLSNFAIHLGATSIEVRTGLWRTMRPVIDYDKCNACTWICGTYCPDGAIAQRADGFPDIDYDHCKGCLICAVQCPAHAIESITEQAALEGETELSA